jgi:hypothetical protein
MRVNQQAVMTSLNPVSEGKTVFDEINQHLTEPTPTIAPVADPSAVVEFEAPASDKPKAVRAPRAKAATPAKAPTKTPAKPRKTTKATGKAS